MQTLGEIMVEFDRRARIYVRSGAALYYEMARRWRNEQMAKGFLMGGEGKLVLSGKQARDLQDHIGGMQFQDEDTLVITYNPHWLPTGIESVTWNGDEVITESVKTPGERYDDPNAEDGTGPHMSDGEQVENTWLPWVLRQNPLSDGEQNERLQWVLRENPLPGLPPLDVWLGNEHGKVLEQFELWRESEGAPSGTLRYWLNVHYPEVAAEYSALTPSTEHGLFSDESGGILIDRQIWPRAENIEAEPQFKDQEFAPLRTWLASEYPHTFAQFDAWDGGLDEAACERFLAERHPDILAEARGDGAIGG